MESNIDIGTLISFNSMTYVTMFMNKDTTKAMIFGPCSFSVNGDFISDADRNIYKVNIDEIIVSRQNKRSIQEEIKSYQTDLPQLITRHSTTSNKEIDSIILFRIRDKAGLNSGENILNVIADAGTVDDIFDKIKIGMGMKFIYSDRLWAQKIKPRVDMQRLLFDICQDELNINPQYIQAAHEQYKLATIKQKTIIKYMLCGIVGYNDKIDDGFFDIGRTNNDHSYNFDLDYYIAKWSREPTGREIIYVNRNEDLTLDKVFNSWKLALDQIYDVKIKAITLAQMVDIFYVSDKDRDNVDDLFMKEMTRVTSYTYGVMELGKVIYGVCRHKSLLYKYLCDRYDIKCALIRGDVVHEGGHAWNLVSIDGNQYLIDVRNKPDRLIEEHEFQQMDFYKDFRRLHKKEHDRAHVGMSILGI
jgi:transglutaminase/protease-like cytokinesis protein 3